MAKLGPGARIADQFTLIRKIGEGGCGEVYLAEQNFLDRKAVVKLMHPELSRDPSYVARFRREAKLADSLRHHHTAAIYAFGETPDRTLWIAMEYIEGDSLHTVLAREPPRQVAELLAPVADVLDRAGDLGIIHRDVKPDNIIVAPDGPGRRAVLLDFGLARPMQDNDKLTQAGVAVGSPTYMSPEQVFGPSVDSATDRYALGIILYIAVAKRPPFRHEDRVQLVLMHKRVPVPELCTIVPSIPKGHPLDAFFTRALAKQPTDRFRSAREMIAEFIQILDNLQRGDAPRAESAPAEAPRGIGARPTVAVGQVAPLRRPTQAAAAIQAATQAGTPASPPGTTATGAATGAAAPAAATTPTGTPATAPTSGAATPGASPVGATAPGPTGTAPMPTVTARPTAAAMPRVTAPVRTLGTSPVPAASRTPATSPLSSAASRTPASRPPSSAPTAAEPPSAPPSAPPSTSPSAGTPADAPAGAPAARSETLRKVTAAPTTPNAGSPRPRTELPGAAPRLTPVKATSPGVSAPRSAISTTGPTSPPSIEPGPQAAREPSIAGSATAAAGAPAAASASASAGSVSAPVSAAPAEAPAGDKPAAPPVAAPPAQKDSPVKSLHAGWGEPRPAGGGRSVGRANLDKILRTTLPQVGGVLRPMPLSEDGSDPTQMAPRKDSLPVPVEPAPPVEAPVAAALPGHRRLLLRGTRQLDVLCASEMSLGKHRDCDLVCRAFPSPEQDAITHGVSRQHARLKLVAGKLSIEDLSSLNGTYLDDKRITGGPVALYDEARVRLGPVLTLEVKLFKSGAALLRRVDDYHGDFPATLLLWDRVALGEPALLAVPHTGDSVTRWGSLQNRQGEAWWTGPDPIRWQRKGGDPVRPQTLQPGDRLVLGGVLVEWDAGAKPGL